MRIHSAATLLLAFTVGAGTLVGQNLAAQPIDIYSNFAGTWVGNVSYIATAPQAPDSVRLVITETPAHDAIICDYTINKKGEPRYVHRIKRITLNPAEEMMTSRWDNNDTEYLKTTGLKAFASTGFGSFIAETLGNNGPTDPVLTHLFHL
ncbi:MAG: hypothetical protein ACRD3K_02820, partial [Edaphobacter sp.]